MLFLHVFLGRQKTISLGTILALTVTIFPWSFAQDSCDQCFFTSDDAEDCRVYGKIDGVLVSWLQASEDCLDAYQIQNTGIDPFSVGCDPINVNTFVNSGLSGGTIPNSVLAGLGVSEGGFYEGDDVYVLKDNITVNGFSYDCQASQSDCYNAMKAYFTEFSDGAQEVADVCDKILGQVRVDRELEQSDARNRICQDIKDGTTTPSTDCGLLVDEVQSAVEAEPDKSCSGFAFGSGTTTAPGCEGLDPVSNNSSTTKTTTSASAMVPSNACWLTFTLWIFWVHS